MNNTASLGKGKGNSHGKALKGDEEALKDGGEAFQCDVKGLNDDGEALKRAMENR